MKTWRAGKKEGNIYLNVMVLILVLIWGSFTQSVPAHARALTSVSVAPQDPIISVGQTQQFTAAGTFDDMSTHVFGTSVQAIAPGTTHTCAVLSDGIVRCWGDDTDGQLGDGNSGTNVKSLIPVSAIGIDNAVSVASSHAQYHTCAILADSTVRCWGYGVFGQLGDGNHPNVSSTPVTVIIKDNIGNSTPLTGALWIAAGGSHTCAVLSDSTVWCWGANGNGQVGQTIIQNYNNNYYSAVKVPGISNAVGITAGNVHTCALLLNGDVMCWGNNGDGQLGYTTTYPNISDVPLPVNGIHSAIAVTAGDNHTCALFSDGTIKCWGNNVSGQIGNGLHGTGLHSTNPVDVNWIGKTGTTNPGATAIAAGKAFTCALLSDSNIMCWGSNALGQTGSNSSTATAVWEPDLTKKVQDKNGVPITASAIAAGSEHACAILLDGMMQCWGSNKNGQVGTGAGPFTTKLYSTNVIDIFPVQWTSSNPVVAGIDFRGLADGLSAGTTTITAAVDGITGTTNLQVVVCVDSDLDGYGSPGSPLCLNGALTDCDDTNANIHPNANEICNGADDNCDRQTDEGFTGLSSFCVNGTGACKAWGSIVCTPDGSGTTCGAGLNTPTDEVYNGIDDDCNGVVDDVVNYPPILDPIGPKSVSEGALLNFSINGSDRDSAILTFSASGLPEGALFDPETKSFSWTPGYLQAGVYNVTFTVSDGALKDSKVVEIQVSNTNRAPVIDPLINQYGVYVTMTGHDIEFLVNGSDPDGDALVFSVVESLPAGAGFNPDTRIFSWMPAPDQAGIYTLTFTVSDGNLTDQRQAVVKVLNENSPVGNNIQVSSGDVDLQFPSVQTPGNTWINKSHIGPNPPPGLWVDYPPHFYYIHTTADIAGPVSLGIHYNPDDFQKTTSLPISDYYSRRLPINNLPISDLPISDLPISDLPISDLPISDLPIPNLPISDLPISDLPISDLSALRLLHYVNGQWVDVTTSHDMVNNVIYGQSDTLSPFAIMIADMRPPVISVEVSPQANIQGWHNQDVTVTFNCSDLESGITVCPDAVIVAAEGANRTFSGTAVDAAGNTAAASVTINLDKTPPVLTCPMDTEILAMYLTGTPSNYAGIQTFLSGASAVDNLDTSVRITTDAPGIFPVGQTPVTFTADDDAGNRSSCQAKVTVVSPKANSSGSSSYFSEGGYNAYAAFDVKYTAGAVIPSGSLTFTSSRYRRKIVSTGISSLSVNGKTAVYTGPCTLNGATGYSFTATVMDNATPGSGMDTFAITVTGPNGFNYSASGTIVSGDYNVSK